MIVKEVSQIQYWYLCQSGVENGIGLIQMFKYLVTSTPLGFHTYFCGLV
jgi:hypothetical protein